MAIRKNITIGEGLDAMIKRYNYKYPNNKLNISRICQAALEREVLRQTGERLIERGELESNPIEKE